MAAAATAPVVTGRSVATGQEYYSAASGQEYDQFYPMVRARGLYYAPGTPVLDAQGRVTATGTYSGQRGVSAYHVGLVRHGAQRANPNWAQCGGRSRGQSLPYTSDDLPSPPFIDRQGLHLQGHGQGATRHCSAIAITQKVRALYVAG